MHCVRRFYAPCLMLPRATYARTFRAPACAYLVASYRAHGMFRTSAVDSAQALFMSRSRVARVASMIYHFAGYVVFAARCSVFQLPSRHRRARVVTVEVAVRACVA